MDLETSEHLPSLCRWLHSSTEGAWSSSGAMLGLELLGFGNFYSNSVTILIFVLFFPFLPYNQLMTLLHLRSKLRLQ